MAEITVQPIMMGNAKLTLGTDDYEAHVSSAMFTPGNNTPVVFKGLSQESVHTFAQKATWTLDLEYAQDHETANSLALYLLENEGETVTALFEPVDGGAGYSADVIITPGAIGGAVDTVATGSVSLGVSGRPVRIPAV
jgi:hypothetical protein